MWDAIAFGVSKGWLEAARDLCLGKSSLLLKDELFLDVLRTSILSSPELEWLLTALRRVLLDAGDLDAAKQCFSRAVKADSTNSSHWFHLAVVLEGLGELDAAAQQLTQALRLDPTREEAARRLAALLRRVDIGGIQPHGVREAIAQRLAVERDERERAARIPVLGVIAHETSRKVAQFYESSPYPPWSSVVVHRNYQATLTHFLGPDRAAFLHRPFEVLIAGCGTGQQVVQSALHYGPNARILALDLSAASLGYASRMADGFGIENVEFVRADLEQIDSFGPQFASRFQVIEAVGVLHHMADPFAGWKALLKCLAPDGLMRIGLYSAIARRNLTSLRSDPAYPGAGCDDAALRAFRQVLLERQDAQGRDARKFVDFWDTGSFRDMLLHVSEQTLGLARIARFFDEERLEFRGFQLPKESQAMFWRRYPFETWPGTLENWARFEEENPFLFQNMYMFWCEKA